MAAGLANSLGWPARNQRVLAARRASQVCGVACLRAPCSAAAQPSGWNCDAPLQVVRWEVIIFHPSAHDGGWAGRRAGTRCGSSRLQPLLHACLPMCACACGPRQCLMLAASLIWVGHAAAVGTAGGTEGLLQVYGPLAHPHMHAHLSVWLNGKTRSTNNDVSLSENPGSSPGTLDGPPAPLKSCR